MSNQRIEIIIQEINYWKEHKLLPDVYCDFLLALYTKGESEIETSMSSGERRLGLTPILQFMGQFLLLLLVVIVINMQQMNLFFQIIFLLLSFLAVFWLFKLLTKERDLYFHLSTVILMVHFFLITLFLGNQYFNIQWGTNIIIIANFICWFVVGGKYQLKYLQIISVILTIITIIYTFL